MAGTVRDLIRDNLGEITLQKIESRLLTLYHLSVNEGLSEFEKLDEVLREFFGDGAEGLEKKIIEASHSEKSREF